MFRFFGGLQGVEKNDLDDKILDLCEALNMREKLKDQVKSLSGGTKRKTNLAMALIGKNFGLPKTTQDIR